MATRTRRNKVRGKARPRVRTELLKVYLSEELDDALNREAEAADVSRSRFVYDLLKARLLQKAA